MIKYTPEYITGSRCARCAFRDKGDYSFDSLQGRFTDSCYTSNKGALQMQGTFFKTDLRIFE